MDTTYYILMKNMLDDTQSKLQPICIKRMVIVNVCNILVVFTHVPNPKFTFVPTNVTKENI